MVLYDIDTNGFDNGSASGTAYALLIAGGVAKVYTLNLTTGAATADATLTGMVKSFAIGLGFSADDIDC